MHNTFMTQGQANKKNRLGQSYLSLFLRAKEIKTTQKTPKYYLLTKLTTLLWLCLLLLSFQGFANNPTYLKLLGARSKTRFTSTPTFRIDRQSPSTSVTNRDELTFRVTFSEPMQGVDVADFVVNGSTAMVTSVTDVGSDNAYDITISGGDLANLEGVVGLNLAPAQNIQNLSGLSLPNIEPDIDETYTIDNTAPQVVSITRYNPISSPTNQDVLSWVISFNEQMSLSILTKNYFKLLGTTAQIVYVGDFFGTGSSVLVEARWGDLPTLNGTVTLNFAENFDIRDKAGNILMNKTPTGTNENTFAVDNTGPVSTSITRYPSISEKSNQDELTWRVHFDGPVLNVGVNDFTVSGTTAQITGFTKPFNNIYQITISGGDLANLNNIVTLGFAANQDITDLYGNPLINPTLTGYFIPDNTAPLVASIVRANPTTSPTSADQLFWDVTFSETMRSLTVSDFELLGTTANIISVQYQGGSTYRVRAFGGDLPGLNGSVTLNVLAGQGGTDQAGNALTNTTPTGTNENVFIVDNSAPEVVNLNRFNPATNITKSNVLTWIVNFDRAVENVSTGDFVATNANVFEVTKATDDTYYVKALANLNSTVTLSFSAGQNITDALGNVLTNTTPTGINNDTYVVDNINPEVVSILRKNPATNSSSADVFTWEVVFNEQVNQVSPDDFEVSGTSATVTNINNTGNNTYEVTISGGDLANLNGVVTLNFAVSQNIIDLAGNALNNFIPTNLNQNTFTVDNTAPSVTSIVRGNPASNTTNADALTWNVTFDGAMGSVNTSDFEVLGTTATVTQIANSSGNTYQVTASGGDLASLNATVTLRFSPAQIITDAAGNYLTNTTPTGSNENTYLVDNVAPRVESIVRNFPNINPSNNPDGMLAWEVTFDKTVQNVDVADFEVSGTTATVYRVTNTSGNTYKIDVSGGDLMDIDGTVTLSFAAGQNITDAAGNALANFTPTTTNENTFRVDNVWPTVVSVTHYNPISSPTNVDVLAWEVTFSEELQSVTTSNFSTSNATVNITNVTHVSGQTYRVTASGGDLASLDGSVKLRIHGGKDLAGNNFINTDPTGTDERLFVIDNRGPYPLHIDRYNPPLSTTDADTLIWEVVFIEGVRNLDASDFTISGTTADITDILQVTDSTYRLTVTGGNLASLDGAVTLNFSAGQNITDRAGNALLTTTPVITNHNTFVRLNTLTGPAVTNVKRINPTTVPSNTNTLVWDVTFDEYVFNVSKEDFRVLSGTATQVIGVTQQDAFTHRVFVSIDPSVPYDGNVTLSFTSGQNIVNAAAQPLFDITPNVTDECTFKYDSKVPTLISFKRQNPVGQTTNADQLTFLVTFSEAMLGVSSTDFTVTGTSASIAVNPISSSIYEVVVSGGDLAGLNGTVGLNLSNTSYFTDLAGNVLVRAEPSVDETYQVDNNIPNVISFTRKSPTSQNTSADQLTFLVTFDRDVTGVDANDFSAVGTTANISVGQLTASTYEVTLLGGDLAELNGNVLLNLAAGVSINSLTGRALLNIEPNTDESYTLCNWASNSATNLQVSTITTNSINLASFTAAIGGADGYVIKINNTNTFTAPANGATLPGAQLSWANSGEQVVYVGASVTPNATITGLDLGTTYYLKVFAYKNCFGNNTFESNGVISNVTTLKLNQTITFDLASNATKLVNDASFNLTATASSGLGVTYASSNPSVATISGNTVTIKGAGSTTITVSQAGNTQYNAATEVQAVLTVNKLSQTISFDLGANATKKSGDAAFNLTATASSGLGVTYTSSNPLVATIIGNTVTIVGEGSTTITAFQTGNDNYQAATDVSQTLTVAKASQTITFDLGSNASKIFGDASFDLSATASSGLGVTYTSSNTSVATILGNTVTIVGAGTANIIANQAGNANYSAATSVSKTLTVERAEQTISFALGTDANKALNDPAFELKGTASSGLSIVYVCSNPAIATISGNQLTIVGAGTATITALQTGNTNYKPATSVSQTLTVGQQSNQTITFDLGTDAVKTFGDANFNLGATASSGLGVTYTSSNSSVATVSGSTVTIVGAGSTTITASQAGNASYNAASSVSQTLIVNKASQTIAFDLGINATKTIGDAGFTVSATGGASGNPITFVSTDPTVAKISGNTVSLLGAGTAIIVAFQSGNDNYEDASISQTLTVNKFKQVITFDLGADTSKVFGDASFALNARGGASNNPVFFISDNPSVATVSGNEVTIVGAGTATITASQSGNAYYDAVSVSQTLTVNKANQTINFNLGDDAFKTTSDASFALQATGGASDNPVLFTSSNPTVATISGNMVTIIGAGTATITASQAGNTNYNAAPEVTQVLTVSQLTGLPVNLKNAQLILYPNPTPEVLHFQLNGQLSSSEVQITIWDQKGTKVMEAARQLRNGKTTLSLRALAEGSYLLKIKIGKEAILRRVIKQ